jgi:hypothetical protein
VAAATVELIVRTYAIHSLQSNTVLEHPRAHIVNYGNLSRMLVKSDDACCANLAYASKNCDATLAAAGSGFPPTAVAVAAALLPDPPA